MTDELKPTHAEIHRRIVGIAARRAAEKEIGFHKNHGRKEYVK